MGPNPQKPQKLVPAKISSLKVTITSTDSVLTTILIKYIVLIPLWKSCQQRHEEYHHQLLDISPALHSSLDLPILPPSLCDENYWKMSENLNCFWESQPSWKRSCFKSYQPWQRREAFFPDHKNSRALFCWISCGRELWPKDYS